jgi:hypothetical protein
MGGRGNSGN